MTHGDPCAYLRGVNDPIGGAMLPAYRRPIPLVSTALALALTAYSTLKPPRASDSARDTATELVIVLAVALVTFFMTGRALREPAAGKPSGRTALALSVVSIVAVGAFAIGLVSVLLAGAASVLALEARERGNAPRAATAAVVVAGVAVVLSALIAIVS
jgi:hypothetical protein